MSSQLKAEACAKPTVGAGYAKGLLNFAVSKGASREELLASSQIAPFDLDDLDNRIPLAGYVALFEAAARLLNEPAIALQYGEAVRVQEISIVGLICEACEATQDVGVQLNRFARLMFDESADTSPAFVRVTREGSGAWIEATSAFVNSNPFVAEAEFARLVGNARAMFTTHPDFHAASFPLAMHFTHPEPAHRAEYERIFRAPITFGAKWNAMLVDGSFLSLKQPPVSRYVFGALSERAEALLKSLGASKTARGKVEALLIPSLHAGNPNIERIAAEMGISRQTLYRKLKAEGVTFEVLLDELRHKMAIHYLDGKKASVREAAYLVGFSEASAFSRAFKRWTGASPRNRSS